MEIRIIPNQVLDQGSSMEEEWALDHDPRVKVKDLFLRRCLRIIPNQALDQIAAVEEEWTLDYDPRVTVKDLFLR